MKSILFSSLQFQYDVDVLAHSHNHPAVESTGSFKTLISNCEGNAGSSAAASMSKCFGEIRVKHRASGSYSNTSNMRSEGSRRFDESLACNGLLSCET